MKKRLLTFAAVILAIGVCAALALFYRLLPAKDQGDKEQACANALAFSPDGKWIAYTTTELPDRSFWSVVVTICDGHTGRKVKALSGHGLKIEDLVFSPDSLLLASCACDGRAILWDTRDWKQVHTFEFQEIPRKLTFSHDGRSLAVGTGFGKEGFVFLFDVTTRRLKLKIDGFSFAVYDLAFSPDGGTLFSVELDRFVRAWDTTTGKCTNQFEGIPPDLPLGVDRIAVRPNPLTLACGGGKGTVKIWDLATGDWKLDLTFGERGGIGPEWRAVQAIQFSPDGKYLAIGTIGEASLWNTADWSLLDIVKEHRVASFGLRFSPSGTHLATGLLDDEGNVRLWRVTDVIAGK